MHPQLFRILSLGAPSYFVMLMTGFIFATVLGVLWAKRVGEDPDVIVNLGLGALLAGVVGARILHVLADGYFWDYVHLCTNPHLVDWHLSKVDCLSPRYKGVWDAAKGVCHPTERNCFAWAEIWNGGLTYYGGFIGATLLAWYQLKADRFSFWKAADMAGFAIPTGLGFGRMGCLLAGCCFGVRTNGPFGLSFPPNSPASDSQFKAHLIPSLHQHSLPVLPTQILESGASFGIALFCLYFVHPRKRYDGEVFIWFVVLYAAARFILEYFRADDRGGLLVFSTSQWMGLLFIGLALAVHFLKMRSLAKRASS